MINKTIFVFCVAISSYIVAEIVDVKPCPNVPQDQCTISEVRIEPCKEKPQPCKFKKGINASISFDFTPNFDATKLKAMIYWANGALEPPFLDMDDNGCQFTNCPCTSGQSQQLNYQLHVGRKLPSGTYPIKWKLWNEEDTNQICCFMTSIKLRR